MSADRRQIHLNAFLRPNGHHQAAWRVPAANPLATTDLDHFVRLAAIAERGAMDSLFLADGVSLSHGIRFGDLDEIEPITLLAAVAARTQHVGLIATVSTTYNEPYNVARRLASLDHVSGGRAGWNIVTSSVPDEAGNFGLDGILPHAERYRRAAEFVEVTKLLWNSWDDDARPADPVTGVYTTADGIRRIDHRGAFYRVDGPLNVAPAPQGYPLLVQAGSSSAGRQLAATVGEAIFTVQAELSTAIAFADDVRALAVRAGRDPSHLKIMPGVVPILGSTEAEARRREEELAELISVERGLDELLELAGADLRGLDLDGPIPPLGGQDAIETNKSRFQVVKDLAQQPGATVRDVVRAFGTGRGHHRYVGTPEGLADVLETWFRAGAADGFNVMSAVHPTDLELVVDHVVPILRARGLYRHEYEGATLRDRYGLPRPAGRRAAALGAAR